ncbi:MAG: glycoside hydrolase family 125 protein [Deltaproteobacteria bacterium]|nr:glycoside hydrolase family 125 protein [Deltaproteobacteria bacterium]
MVKIHDGRLLTTPEELAPGVPWLVTGNEYVSLPTLRPTDGAVERLGVLHFAEASLLEVCGSSPAAKEPGSEALFLPRLVRGGVPEPLAGKLTWERLGDFVPRFRYASSDGALGLEGTVFAPPGEKGFVYALRVEHRGAAGVAAVELELGLDGSWGDSLQTVFTSGRVHGVHRASYNRWLEGPVFELRAGTARLGWAVMASEALTRCDWGAAAGEAAVESPASAESAASTDSRAATDSPRELTLPVGEPLRFGYASTLRLAPGEARTLAFYVAVNREGDGARTTAIHLARRGFTDLLDETLAWHAARRVLLPRAPEADRARLEQVANLNLAFNRLFALGRTIDTEELVAITSRSPRYYVSAAFWSRDSFLWSLPAVALTDTAAARELLLNAFTRHLRNAGVHALYLDGAVLYPGFELDELCAFVLGIDTYVRHSGELAFLDEPLVRQTLGRVETELFRHRHGTHWLFDTFLYPSDDPATYPYLTYDNALVARTFELLADWAELKLLPAARPTHPRAEGLTYRQLASAVRQAIFEHLVVPGPLGPMFAWSTDLGAPPRHKVYDEPPGSLQLLAHYGLCSLESPVLQNTIAWIHSPHNPYAYEGRFAEVGCPHSEHPFVMGLFNSLLCGRAESTRETLAHAPLDGGLACEAFDRESGEAKTGAAFATCAGFLGYAMWKAWG